MAEKKKRKGGSSARNGRRYQTRRRKTKAVEPKNKTIKTDDSNQINSEKEVDEALNLLFDDSVELKEVPIEKEPTILLVPQDIKPIEKNEKEYKEEVIDMPREKKKDTDVKKTKEENLKSILSGLHFKNGLDSKVSELSGGEKIKVLLSILLLQNADILLLDEPTNNLDIEAIKWLENYLKSTNKKMIIVSHDEVFLDTIVNRIFELRDGNIKVYNMSYKEYLTQKEIEYNRSKQEYENAKAEKDKLKKQLVKATSWKDKGTSSKAHNDNDKLSNNYARERTNSSNVSKISKALDKVVIPKFEEKESINFFFELDDSKGNKDIILNDLVCGYDKFQTLPINLNIKYGSKIQIEGGNGSGKTTLIKTIMGIISPISGTIEMGNNVRIGYISQDTLTDNNDESIIDYITKDSSDVDYSMIFTMLDKFGISYEDKDKKYSTLSPGERTRVNLVKLALNKINVLILDEVTNHLDIDALNLIYELVSSYNGTIISISHNRKYNEILNATSVLDIEKGICCSYELAKQKRP